MNGVVIDIRDLSFGYDGAEVLSDVSLEIHDGDFVCVVGPNGGGKTTLLRLALGLLEPTTGSIRVFGQPPREAAPLIGYMPQQSLLDPRFPVSALDVALMGRLGRRPQFGPFRRADRQAAMVALDRVELADLRDRPFAALSGGQRQRVLIARALACEPRLLLFDEPTAGLDVHVEGEFLELLRELNKQLTIIIVSHDLGFVSSYVDHVVCVSRIVHTHPTSELTGEMIASLYGGEVRMIRHDHIYSASGHVHAGEE